jgi:AraC-like DNA-binding protein
MIMKYFQGLRWLNRGVHPHDCSLVRKRFNNSYGITYLHQGAVSYRFNSQAEMLLEAPVVWIYFPGPLFTYGALKDSTWHNRFINFTGPRVKKYIETGLFPAREQPPVFKISQPERFKASFEELYEYLERPVRNENRSVYLLEGLLLQLNEERNSQTLKDGLQNRKILKIYEEIQNEPEAEWDFKFESERLKMSYSHFRRLFKQSSGTSPMQLVIRCRLEKAAKLMVKTDKSMDEIASESGIEDIHYFSRLFKKYFFMPPGKYRREMQL